ncbi:hypothetical protein [Streptomyces sp. NPDC048252]
MRTRVEYLIEHGVSRRVWVAGAGAEYWLSALRSALWRESGT